MLDYNRARMMFITKKANKYPGQVRASGKSVEVKKVCELSQTRKDTWLLHGAATWLAITHPFEENMSITNFAPIKETLGLRWPRCCCPHTAPHQRLSSSEQDAAEAPSVLYN